MDISSVLDPDLLFFYPQIRYFFYPGSGSVIFYPLDPFYLYPHIRIGQKATDPDLGSKNKSQRKLQEALFLFL